MKPELPPSELALAFSPIKPVLYKAVGFSLIISLLALAPTVYMLEVYDRVVNSRSGMTLVMLTVLVVLMYAVMEILEKLHRLSLVKLVHLESYIEKLLSGYSPEEILEELPSLNLEKSI
jgi:ABC-type protease/lipase transport system fused ATPase/permease subunit